jgi:uncharacterized protein YndB with AHSA1/START domain
MNTDRIAKEITIQAPRERVWRALTDHVEFGTWFGVKMEAPFAIGKTARGQITYPGFEHLTLSVVVQVLEPPKRFVFTWHPYAIDPAIDYSTELPTTVEFHLTEKDGGTLLQVVESGFDRLPPERRSQAFRMNDDGWEEQIINIQRHVATP